LPPERPTGSRHFTVGPITFVTAGFSPDLVMNMAENEVDRQLREHQAAYDNRHPAAIRQAFELWHAHRPHRALPVWMREGVAQALTGSTASGKKRGGRLSNERTLRRQRMIDFVRASYVNRLMSDDGVTYYAACKRAASELRIEVDGAPTPASSKVIDQAYKRFYQRLLEAPHEFYPFLTAFGHLEVLMAPRPGSVAAKIIQKFFSARRK
jgi:hypothetical protein